LRELAGPGADVVRVHDDAGADRVAVVHSADAVAVGADVYFRDGRFRPDEPAGFGLLAHEASHVSTTLETSGVERATEGGRAAEEATALHLERKARHTLAPPTLDPHTPARNGGVRNPSATAGHPLTAEAAAGPLPPGAVGPPMPGPGPAVWGSTAGPSTGGAASTPTTGAAPLTAAPMTAAVDRQLDSQPPFDVAALRRDLVADLVSRLRSEFERGA
jgi:hypothetical protein